MVVVLRSGVIAVRVFGVRRVVGMGLIFERVLFVDLNIMRGSSRASASVGASGGDATDASMAAETGISV